ncbi:MAG: Rieske 2Fe-2S domain-containing protein [Alphaproteobacteria bacterium]|nr:Rieske 2Fe-2S domain-containing protein [Alphaproteobacteria bacterium]
MTIDPAIRFPHGDYSRVPYALYHDRAVYDAEQERIFKGPAWNFLGLEVEIPKPGDFRTSVIGDTPVVFNRGTDGKVHAFVNRCAHRGALLRREAYGNASDHTCIYHRWNYDLEGNLVGVPFQRGVNGKGGLGPDFDKRDHGLRKLRVESFAGILFTTFADETEPLRDYLGEPLVRFLEPRFGRPLAVLGYMRQRIFGNWKFYVENIRDMYHGSLLHEFQATFGISRVTYTGGTRMDPRHRHNISWGIQGTEASTAETHKMYKEANLETERLKLREMAMVDYRPEFDDQISIGICSVFPNACFQQIRNSLAARQVRPRGPDDFDLYWTILGYADDTPDMTQHRLRQSNMIGPAGFISMEDGEAVEIAHRGVKRDPAAHAVVEMGGKGEISDRDNRVNDVPIRGFWSYYAELMGMEPAGAVR